MGHSIKAIIGNKDVVDRLKDKITDLEFSVEKLPQDYYLIYYSEALAEYVLKQELDNKVLEYLQKNLSPLNFVVIETDYFGGSGEQTASLVRDDEKVLVHYSDGSGLDRSLAYPERMLNEPINAMLRGLGVARDFDKDEFDTLELWKYRQMKD